VREQALGWVIGGFKRSREPARSERVWLFAGENQSMPQIVSICGAPETAGSGRQSTGRFSTCRLAGSSARPRLMVAPGKNAGKDDEYDGYHQTKDHCINGHQNLQH